MQHPLFRNRIVLRVDIDYPALYPGALQSMLTVLGETGAKATFFVNAGGGECSLSLRNMIRPAYIRRLLQLKAWRIIPRLFSKPERPDHLARRIMASGHEVAVHGFRHRWWMENINCASEKQIQTEIDMAYQSLSAIPESSCFAWGSPGWRTNRTALKLLARRPVPYFAECWGSEPFATVCEGWECRHIPHLPITLPSLETLLLTQNYNAEQAVERVLDRPCDRYDMLVCHDYFEGGGQREAFAYLLGKCREKQITLSTVGAMASAIVEAGLDLPPCYLSEQVIPGFMGKASVQRSPA